MANNQDLVSKTDILSKTGRNLYLSAEKADVHFTFESDTERVPAHKIILAGGSDVFETMFYGSWKEDGDVKIVDSTLPAFKEFLRFFYFNAPILSEEHVPEIMYLSKKYNVTECHQACASLLETSLTSETVLSTLNLAIFHEHQQLQRSCETLIAANLQGILKSVNFLSCDREVLQRIVKMDRGVTSETEMFEACMSWVRATSEENHLTRYIVQTRLENLFYEIRFGDMTLEEFTKLLPVYGELFSANEYSEILQVISGQETEPKIFNVRRRLPPSWDSTKLILCNREFATAVHEVDCCILGENVTKFSTNTPLLLGYFTISEMLGCDDIEITAVENIPDVNVTISTIVSSTTNTLTQFTCTIYKSTSHRYKVDLPNPISITPGTIYSIQIKIPLINENHVWFLPTSNSITNMDEGIVLTFYNVAPLSRDIVHSLAFNSLSGGLCS